MKLKPQLGWKLRDQLCNRPQNRDRRGPGWRIYNKIRYRQLYQLDGRLDDRLRQKLKDRLQQIEDET